MVTGFELDNQRIAAEQVRATRELAAAIKDLTNAIKNAKPNRS